MGNKQNRRAFLGNLWMGATAAAVGGCMSDGFRLGGTGPMQCFADKPMRKLRVGRIRGRIAT